MSLSGPPMPHGLYKNKAITYVKRQQKLKNPGLVFLKLNLVDIWLKIEAASTCKHLFSARNPRRGFKTWSNDVKCLNVPHDTRWIPLTQPFPKTIGLRYHESRHWSRWNIFLGWNLMGLRYHVSWFHKISKSKICLGPKVFLEQSS
jgi:hypothetical protein